MRRMIRLAACVAALAGCASQKRVYADDAEDKADSHESMNKTEAKDREAADKAVADGGAGAIDAAISNECQPGAAAQPGQCMVNGTIGNGIDKCPAFAQCSMNLNPRNFRLERHFQKVHPAGAFTTVIGRIKKRPELSSNDFCFAHWDRDFEFTLDVDKAWQTPGVATSVLAPQNYPEHQGALAIETERMYLFPEQTSSKEDSLEGLLPGKLAGTPPTDPRSQVAVRGTLIWDCGHQGGCGFYSEIHPVLALAWASWAPNGASGTITVRLIGWEPSPSLQRSPLDEFEARFDIPGDATSLVPSEPEPLYIYRNYTVWSAQGCHGRQWYRPDRALRHLVTPAGYVDGPNIDKAEALRWFKFERPTVESGQVVVRVTPTRRLRELHDAQEAAYFPVLAGFTVSLKKP